MKSEALPKDEFLKHPQALRIWEEIITSYNTYTNDSSVVRFFLPEQLILHCRPVAAAFTSLPYSPTLDPQKVYETSLYYVFLLSTVCGVQIYLKEQAIERGYGPYKIYADETIVKNAKEQALLGLSMGAKLPEPADQVMKKFIAQFANSTQKSNFRLKGKSFDRKRYEYLLPASVFWGYLFAKDMIYYKD